MKKNKAFVLKAISSEPALAISHSTIETYIQDAVTNIEADDYTGARKDIAKASAALLSLPDTGIEGASMRFDRRIEGVLSAIEVAESAFNKTNNKVRFARAVTRLRS